MSDHPPDDQARRDDTKLRATDTAQRVEDSGLRRDDTAQRAEDTAARAEDTVARAEDAVARTEHLAQAVEIAEVSRAEVTDLIDRAQRRARKKSLINYVVLVVGISLMLWRGQLADRRIERNSARLAENNETISRVFREQCTLLAGGFARMNAANADIVVLLESARASTPNPEGLDRFTQDFRDKQLPIPDCDQPPETVGR